MVILAALAAAGVILLGLAAFPNVHGPRWQPGWLGLACIALVATAPTLDSLFL